MFVFKCFVVVMVWRFVMLVLIINIFVGFIVFDGVIIIGNIDGNWFVVCIIIM